MALAVSAPGAKWICTACTFEQSAFNDECQLCGEKNKSVVKPKEDDVSNNDNKSNNENKNKQKYGSIIYQVDRFWDDQLKSTYTLYLKNPNISTSNWSLYLFGDNDIDKSRPSSSEREMIGGQAGVAGKYDRSICF
eukprot:166352_1